MSLPKDNQHKNVQDFFDWCAREVGKFEDEAFYQDMWAYVEDHEIDSPVHQMLAGAIFAVQRLNVYSIEMDYGTQSCRCGAEHATGLFIRHNAEIGPYKNNFVVRYSKNFAVYPDGTYEGLRKEAVVNITPVVVHPAMKDEVNAEAAKTRLMSTKGYQILCYHEEDVLKNAMLVACDIISHLTGLDPEDILLDSNVKE